MVRTAEGPGSISGQGTKIPQAVWSGQKKKKRKTINSMKRQPTEWEKISA